MIDPTILEQTRQAFASLDLSAEHQQVADIQADIGRIDTAIASVRARIDELGEMRRALAKPDGDAIADALLANVDPKTAVSDVLSSEQIDQEQGALRASISTLEKRKREKDQEIGLVQDRARQRAEELAAPLADALLHEAMVAGAMITEANAALVAMSGSFKGVRHLQIVKEAVEALQEIGSPLMDHIAARQTPGPIADLLSVLDEKNIRFIAPGRELAWAKSREDLATATKLLEDEQKAEQKRIREQQPTAVGFARAGIRAV